MITAAYVGRERVELDGEIHTGPNAEGDLARALIGQGVDPTTPLVFTRNGTPALRGTVEAFAKRAWGGNGRDPMFVRWKPHPQGNYPDAVLRWHAQTAPKPVKVKSDGAGGNGLPGAPLPVGNSPPVAPPETRASPIATNQEISPLL